MTANRYESSGTSKVAEILGAGIAGLAFEPLVVYQLKRKGRRESQSIITAQKCPGLRDGLRNHNE